MPEKRKKYHRRSLPEIKKQLKAQEKSGKSIAKFCNDNGIAIATFSLWRKKYSNTASPRFLKINTEEMQDRGFSGTIEISTPKGYSIKIEQSETSLQTILHTIKRLSL